MLLLTIEKLIISHSVSVQINIVRNHVMRPTHCVYRDVNTKVFTFKCDFLEMLAANLILTVKGGSILASINH